MARIDDGFKTLVTFSADSSVALYEKEVTPPGIESGGPIDTTTMHNTAWRTNWPKTLKTVTPASAKCAYDPSVLNEIIAMCGVNQLITVKFPDNSTVKFWGWIDSFKPDRNVDGTQPTAEVEFQPSNQNNSKVETAPVYTAAP